MENMSYGVKTQRKQGTQKRQNVIRGKTALFKPTQAKNPALRRRRRIRDLGPPVHDLTLIDSSDDDAPFVVTRRSQHCWRREVQRPRVKHTKISVRPRTFSPCVFLAGDWFSSRKRQETPRSVQDGGVKHTGGGQIPHAGHDSKRIGCKPQKHESLRTVFRSWGIVDHEHLSRWLGEHGFPATQPGNQLSARAQEALLNEGCRFDVRGGLGRSGLRECCHSHGQRVVSAATSRRFRAKFRQPQCWGTRIQLVSVGRIDLAEVFATRVPTLRKCPIICEGGCVRLSPSH